MSLFLCQRHGIVPVPVLGGGFRVLVGLHLRQHLLPTELDGVQRALLALLA